MRWHFSCDFISSHVTYDALGRQQFSLMSALSIQKRMRMQQEERRSTEPVFGKHGSRLVSLLYMLYVANRHAMSKQQPFRCLHGLEQGPGRFLGFLQVPARWAVSHPAVSSSWRLAGSSHRGCWSCGLPWPAVPLPFWRHIFLQQK